MTANQLAYEVIKCLGNVSDEFTTTTIDKAIRSILANHTEQTSEIAVKEAKSKILEIKKRKMTLC